MYLQSPALAFLFRHTDDTVIQRLGAPPQHNGGHDGQNAEAAADQECQPEAI